MGDAGKKLSNSRFCELTMDFYKSGIKAKAYLAQRLISTDFMSEK
jgi:hypothetical protein